MKQNIFESRYVIGAEVLMTVSHGPKATDGVSAVPCKVEAVRFTASKVLYDLMPDVGGQLIRDVDSVWVTDRANSQLPIPLPDTNR